MSFLLQGIGVSRGIAIGRVHVLQRGEMEIPEYAIPEQFIEDEVERFNNALDQARDGLKEIRNHIPVSTAADITSFIDAHLLMLDDFSLAEAPIQLIREQQCNAEWALQMQRDAVVKVFDQMDDVYLRTRRDDVDHVTGRIQRSLMQQDAPRSEIPDSRHDNYILLAEDLAPSDTVLIKHHGVLAFVTEFGGPTSHTAILARSLQIPAIVGLKQAGKYIRDEEFVIVDSNQGVVLVDPDERILKHYRRLQKEERRYHQALKKLKEAPAVTADGVPISLQANIELPEDIRTTRQAGATGVGLYRTEFLFMNREEPPSEEEQLEDYRRLVRSLKGLPLTIRTLDLGADKQVDGGAQHGPLPTNPALGLRAVRLCLHDPSLFIPQLRAIMRASAYGPVRMLVPMLSSIQEMSQVMALIEQTRTELAAEKLRFDPDMPVGAMIEVPAAAICADIFANRLDFLSIGTNDLIQYTLAVDRVDESVSYLYDPLHPAVLRLIDMILKAGKKAHIPVAMCGEMAGDTRYTRLLLGIGLREFSVHPTSLLEVKHIISESRVSKLSRLSRKAILSAPGTDVEAIIDRMNQTPAL